MGIYISTEYFQIIHYYYFCMGMFSFTAAVIFGFPYSMFFMIFYVLHSIISWYVSYFIQKSMRKFVIIQSREYVISHIILTILTVGSTLMLWYFQVLIETFLIDSIIFINYFVFFIGVLWYGMTKFDVVKGLFAYFDSLTFRKAKKLVIDKRIDLGLKELVTDVVIKTYEVGSDSEIDSILVSVWDERETNVEGNIYRLEMALCDKMIGKYRKRIHKIRSKPMVNAIDVRMMKTYERFIKDYEKSSVEYERFFKEKNSLE